MLLIFVTKVVLNFFSHALILVVFKLSNRDPLAPRGSPGPESDLLSNLLGGANAPVENPVRYLWSRQLGILAQQPMLKLQFHLDLVTLSGLFLL